MEANSELIYLDNAATTFPKPEPVYEAMDSFYRKFGGNAGRGANPLARKAAQLVDETRELVANWLNAPAIIFSPSATISLNTVIMGARLRAGDTVYVSPFEHNSVLRPLEHLRQTVGIQINMISFNKITFECQLDKLEKQFRLEPPSLVCVSQVSNVIGLILPVEQIAQLAKKSNPSAIVCVDGAQAAGLLPLDLSQIDALVFSGHKSFYGPYGIAGIAFGTTWQPEPLIFGGTGTISESLQMPETGPSRFESGSQNIVAIAGLNAAIKWLDKVSLTVITDNLDRLTEELRNSLSQLENVDLILPKDISQHHAIVSCNIKEFSPQSVENVLGSHNIAVRAGLHCAPMIHEYLETQNQGGAVRISVGNFSSIEAIQKTTRILGQLCS